MTPLVIIVPTLFSFESTKVVPWDYGSTVYVHRQKQEEKPLEIKEPIINIVGTRGMTRSGCVFASGPPPEKNNLKT